MAGEKNYVRIPPDSTGKKLKHGILYRINYTNVVGGYTFVKGETYSFSGSVSFPFTVYAVNTVSGYFGANFPGPITYAGSVPIAGDDILLDGVKVAEVASAEEIHIPETKIIGNSNPSRGVEVDDTGSMNVRFSEGLPQLDAFGKLGTSGASILGDYTFANNFLPDQFAITKNGNGSLTHNDSLHAAELRTGTGTATANFGPDANRVQMTTNTYHHYFPGLSQLAIMTVALSDQGQTGVMREWGYFDSEYDNDITGTPTFELTGGNGFFFRVTGESGLQFVIRSFATGQVTETIITRDGTTKTVGGAVVETNNQGWNGDPVDGTGDSQKVFDLRDDNIYWVDVQWLGAGRIRFGTYHRGERIVIHSHYSDGNGGVPSSQTGSLPLKFCQHNMKNQNVVSESFMRVWCASVFTEAAIETSKLGTGQTEYFKALIDPANMNDVQGLNDAFGDRGIEDKTGVTSSGTTLTVPNLTGIKPGWFVQSTGGTGTLAKTRVTEIVNSTTIQVANAPTVALQGDETVSFNMPLDDEYYLIGILAPRPQIKGVNHPNRTLYLPRSLRAYAYHEDGAEAFMSVQVYANPVISGVNRVSNLYDEAEAGALNRDPVFINHEPNDPFCAVMAYGKNGIDTVNLFPDSGYHSLVTYSGGYGGQEDLSGAFTTLQAGFKNAADNGGNNRCPILRIYQSPSAGQATTIQINTPPTGINFSLHREGNAVQFENIPGLIGTDTTYGINNGGASGGAGEIFYLRMIGNDTAELYLDKAFTQPWDTSALSNATNGNSLTWSGNTGDVATGGFILSSYGPELYFCVLAKPQGPSVGGTTYQQAHGKIEVNFSLYWNEIRQ